MTAYFAAGDTNVGIDPISRRAVMPQLRSASSPRLYAHAGIGVPAVINTDRNPAYGEAIRKLKTAKSLDDSVDHRQVKYLNNRLEADHGAIKRRIRSMLGFKSAKAAYATLKGIEAMRMIRKRQCILLKPGIAGEIHFFNMLFGIYT